MKNSWLTLVIILAVIAVGVILITPREDPSSSVPEDIAKCIGENSVLFVQLGCHACETQEEMFGKSYKFLNVIDCWFEAEKCDRIEATPTWEINKQRYRGVKNIDTLQQLTGC
tara:strand:- start:195 stop:533 length:339 start_codon:yes stop_codon:yes gene_type:complete